jgi:long-chain acyl-CoA synthetase
MAAAQHVLEVLHRRAGENRDRPALRQKVAGRWKTLSWGEYARQVELVARGLIALGHQPGQPVGLLGFNRVEWVASYLGAMAARGVPVGIYTTSSPEQVQYLLAHCEATVVVVEDEAQLEKVRSMKDRCPALRWVVTMEPTSAPEDWVLEFEALLARGEQTSRGEYEGRVERIDPGDLATLIYTSGTTGPPKAVMLSHHNLFWTARQAMSVLGDIGEGERSISYLPLSHIAEQQFTIHLGLMFGLEVWFAQSLDPVTLRQNILEVRPRGLFAVPRIWEKFKAGVEAQVHAYPPHRRAIFARARQVGLCYQSALLEGRAPGPWLTAKHAVFDKLVFARVRRALGLDQGILFGSAAAAISREVLDFWLSMGIVIREIYGQSEDCGPTTANAPGATRLGTVGKPLPGVEVRIAEDGEICVRGPNVFMGYYKDPEATAQALDAEGWLHSGDVGRFDEDGFLRLTDRMKELIVTSGGQKASPQNLEAHLKAEAPLSHAVVLGEQRSYLTAILTLDPQAAPEWARARGLPEQLEALCRHPALLAHLKAHVDRVNATLARWETIKRFEVLPRDFTVEAGELTPTMKLRRQVIARTCADVITRLYASEVSDRVPAPAAAR